jgi:hypothetical protein
MGVALRKDESRLLNFFQREMCLADFGDKSAFYLLRHKLLQQTQKIPTMSDV